MPHVITKKCNGCGECQGACPLECICGGLKEGEWTKYYIDPDTCDDCGACAEECPLKAIFTEEEVPEEDQNDIDENARFFQEGPGYSAGEGEKEEEA